MDVEKNNTSEKVPPLQSKQILGVRHLQYILLFFVIFVAYGMRTNMSVGILAMMEEVPPDPSIPTYPEWTEGEKSIILSSFFWGYVIPQIGAGQLVKNYGPKWFLTGAMLINSLFCLLIPIMAENFGIHGVIVCRILQGLSQGFIYPSTHNLLGKWTPLKERSTMASFVYTAGPLGSCISMPITGFISDSNVGWPVAFYLYGAFGISWVVFWIWLGCDSPADHKTISLVEKYFINEGNKADDDQEVIITPWGSIVRSLPFWAILVAHCGQNWGFWTLQTEIPTYMKKVMGYDVNSSSLLSALPYFVLWLLNFIVSPLADMCIVRHYLSIGNTRKVFNTIGLMIPALALVWLGFVDSSDKALALTLLTVAVGMNSAVYSGFNINHIDIAPNFAGTLMGITNSCSNVVSIIAPLAVGALGDDESDPILWQKVFIIAAVIYVLANCFFVICGSGDVQEWNEGEKVDESDEDKKYNK